MGFVWWSNDKAETVNLSLHYVVFALKFDEIANRILCLIFTSVKSESYVIIAICLLKSSGYATKNV